jgi:hypothetical protein
MEVKNAHNPASLFLSGLVAMFAVAPGKTVSIREVGPEGHFTKYTHKVPMHDCHTKFIRKVRR